MIGDRIKYLRKQANLTQSQLAERLNLSQATIASWENGTRRPDLDLLPVLAETFGVSVDELLGREDAEDRPPRTIEARIVSFGMDQLPQDERDRIINVLQAMYANNPDLFKRSEDNDA